jgi:hypothetical protein
MTFCIVFLQTYINHAPEVNILLNSLKGLTDRPIITSKDKLSLQDIRKRVGVSPSVIEEVKQVMSKEPFDSPFSVQFRFAAVKLKFN